VEDPVEDSKNVQFSVSLDKKDWVYNIGEYPVFIVNLTVNGKAVDKANVFYTIGPEKMNPVEKGSAQIHDGKVQLPTATMNEPGFLRCAVRVRIEGKIYKALGT